jgi:hypothetical protein
MRRGLLILVSAVLVPAAIAVVPSAGAVPGALNAGPTPPSLSTTPVHVRPSIGGPRSAFTVTLRIPAQTGTIGQVHRSDLLTASGPRRTGCVSSVQTVLPAAPAGSMVRVRLAPRRGRHWCTGTFHGVIIESQSITCAGGPTAACPMVMIRPQTIARFRFRVR